MTTPFPDTSVPVFLIGFMGCGKTTVGHALAQRTARPFVDLDRFIEHTSGKTVTQLFADLGEDGFRQLESDCLRQVVAQWHNAIVACGGGTPCRQGNMELMNNVGTTVWLTASIHTLVQRLLLPDQKAKRPLIAHLPDNEVEPLVRRLLAARTPFYANARLHFDANKLDNAQQIACAAEQLQELLQHEPFGSNAKTS